MVLAAEQDGVLAGFGPAPLHTGEFGGKAPEAVPDAIGVAGLWRGQGIGACCWHGAWQALRARGVPAITTEAGWGDAGLTGFLSVQAFVWRRTSFWSGV